MHVKKNEIVKIITGKDKGKKGKVLQVLPGENRVVVEGVNMLAKNVRPKKMGEKGQVVRFNAPIHASNVKRVDEKTPAKPSPQPAKKSSPTMLKQKSANSK